MRLRRELGEEPLPSSDGTTWVRITTIGAFSSGLAALRLVHDETGWRYRQRVKGFGGKSDRVVTDSAAVPDAVADSVMAVLRGVKFLQDEAQCREFGLDGGFSLVLEARVDGSYLAKNCWRPDGELPGTASAVLAAFGWMRSQVLKSGILRAP